MHLYRYSLQIDDRALDLDSCANERVALCVRGGPILLEAILISSAVRFDCVDFVYKRASFWGDYVKTAIYYNSCRIEDVTCKIVDV